MGTHNPAKIVRVEPVIDADFTEVKEAVRAAKQRTYPAPATSRSKGPISPDDLRV
ncbi:MAG: hypothetical protein AAFR53_16300 [Pseudomonadota bacterium]